MSHSIVAKSAIRALDYGIDTHISGTMSRSGLIVLFVGPCGSPGMNLAEALGGGYLASDWWDALYRYAFECAGAECRAVRAKKSKRRGVWRNVAWFHPDLVRPLAVATRTLALQEIAEAVYADGAAFAIDALLKLHSGRSLVT